MADIVYPGQDPGGTLGIDFMPANYDLRLYKGDYFPLKLTLKDNAGVAINLTGYTAKAQIRVNFDDPAPYNFNATINAAAGEVNFELPSTVSSTIPAGSYIWDVQVTDPNGNTRTYIAGDVSVHDEVTK